MEFYNQRRRQLLVFTTPIDLANISLSIKIESSLPHIIMIDDFTISLTNPADMCDTDNDGTPDHLDTDSDGDGCLDALEAGFTDANQDGQVDGIGFDADGKVTGGDGYSTPLDIDGSGIADYFEDNVAGVLITALVNGAYDISTATYVNNF